MTTLLRVHRVYQCCGAMSNDVVIGCWQKVSMGRLRFFAIPHRGILQPTNLAAEGVDLLVEFGEIVAVGDEVVGNGDGATLLNILNFRPVAGDCFLGGKGPLGPLSKAAVTELLGCHDGSDNELTREVVSEVLVLCPGVEAVKENVALPSGGEALHLLGSGADDDIFASLFAPGFAKFGL